MEPKTVKQAIVALTVMTALSISLAYLLGKKNRS
jgi:hypothetical protein